ncbi:MAG TPA: hypothetical protein VGP46_05330, partial [Acidimicrobiales bacterium]|nr:hypothetical protein [Acidimicrobiales bacterium]
LPVLHAEDLIRGHRYDVYTQSTASPQWRSLCWREGTYQLGPPKANKVFTVVDEAAVSLGSLSRATNLVKFNPRNNTFGAPVPDPPDLYAHERVHRWTGWSAVGHRPGKSGVGSGTELQENGSNPIPVPTGRTVEPPQLSVTAVPPTTGTDLLPKLRFGALYRYRARAADLAGNGVPATSPDASTATPPAAHLRYKPVESPTLAPTALPVPGEGTQILVILNDQVNPVPPNGRWIFPPKVAQLLAEEHGMLDGFVEGKLPNPDDPPSGATATYDILRKRDPGRLNDVKGVKFYGSNVDSSGSPKVGSPYFPGATKLSLSWLPDPLAAGVCINGLPIAGHEFLTRFYEGGPWPDPEPMLLQLEAGSAPGQAFTAATSTSAAVQTITLPPAAVVDVGISSALYPGAVEPKGGLLGLYTLGVWQWLAEGGLTSAQLKDLEEAAVAGLVWQLSPFRILSLVHAVRIPTSAPTFVVPMTGRAPGSTKAQLFDEKFELSIESTSSLDFMATWTDPVDDVTLPAPTTASYSANAFKMTVDPGFALDTADTTNIQDFGDTLHHTVEYTAIGTSRFNGYFRQTQSIKFAGTSPVLLSTLGVDPASVTLTIPGTKAVVFGEDDFVVEAAAGTVSLTAAGDTLAGG